MYVLPKRRHAVVYQNNPFCSFYYAILTRLLSSRTSEHEDLGGVRQSVTLVEGPSDFRASFRWELKQSDGLGVAKSSGLWLSSYWLMLKCRSWGNKGNLTVVKRKGIICDLFCLVLLLEKHRLVTWNLRTSSEFAWRRKREKPGIDMAGHRLFEFNPHYIWISSSYPRCKHTPSQWHKPVRQSCVGK